ncbi:hypothetical protein [Lysinibacillus sp. NPDC093688]|uniref:hypothetical protein n=1 Tax=Lysinibacillus sp. NPDC093688 TaxID=3390577 RepID=UPI003CFF4DB8
MPSRKPKKTMQPSGVDILSMPNGRFNKRVGFNARVIQHDYDHLNDVLISHIGICIEQKIAH